MELNNPIPVSFQLVKRPENLSYDMNREYSRISQDKNTP